MLIQCIVVIIDILFEPVELLNPMEERAFLEHHDFYEPDGKRCVAMKIPDLKNSGR